MGSTDDSNVLAHQSQRARRTSRFEIEGGTRLLLEWDHEEEELMVDLGVRPGDIAEEPGYSTALGRDEATVLANWLGKVLDG